VFFLLGISVGIPAYAALYKIPVKRDIDTILKTVNESIPAELEKANCGWPKPGNNEDDFMTLVWGVPLRPKIWRGRSTGPVNPEAPNEDPIYPSAREGTEGLVFSSYKEEPTCNAIRNLRPPCRDPIECQNQCLQYNTVWNCTPMTYPV
jgi:hypothetical protein